MGVQASAPATSRGSSKTDPGSQGGRPASSQSPTLSRPTLTPTQCPLERARLRMRRQQHGDHRAVFDRAFETQRAFMLAHDALDQAQPETSALTLGAGVRRPRPTSSNSNGAIRGRCKTPPAWRGSAYIAVVLGIRIPITPNTMPPPSSSPSAQVPPVASVTLATQVVDARAK